MNDPESILTTPISNLAQFDLATFDRYYKWMLSSPGAGVARAKEALGKQDKRVDYSVRNYVWTRPFEFDGNQMVWRMYASKRGLSLEVEDRLKGVPWHKLPESVQVALANAAMDAFFKVWGYNEDVVRTLQDPAGTEA